MTELPVTSQQLHLVEVGLKYGLDLIDSGVELPFQPAAVIEAPDGGLAITQLVMLGSTPDWPTTIMRPPSQRCDAARSAVVVDGAFGSEDAVIVVVSDRGGSTHRFGQRYKVSRFRKRVEQVGNPGHVGEDESLFDASP